jgi:hypothetical protein
VKHSAITHLVYLISEAKHAHRHAAENYPSDIQRIKQLDSRRKVLQDALDLIESCSECKQAP